MAKFVFFCFTLLAINQNIAVSATCDYVLCNVKSHQTNDDIGYHASGSAISSQFVMPDGSLVTNSKESSISSNGIKTTFQELKKEADRFVQTGSSNIASAIPKVPIAIPVVHEIPYSPITKIPFPYITGSTYLSGGSQGASQQQSSISQASQAQVQSSSNGVVQHQYQTIPKVTSYTKEQKIEKKVVTTSKGGSEYPSAIGGGQYQHVQQNNIDTNSNLQNVAVPLRFPSEGSNVNYQVGSSYNQVAGSAVAVPLQPSQQSAFQSSYESSSSSSSSSQSNNQQPSSFYTGVIDLNLNSPNQGDVHTYISHGVPTVRVNTNSEHKEHHYEQDSSQTGGGVLSALPQYNAVGGVGNIKYQQEDYHSKSKDYEGGYKPIVSTIQYGTETNSTHVHNAANSGLPTAHVSKVVVRVPQTLESSQSYQKQESASSQVSGYGGQFSSSGPGVVYTPGVQVPVGNSASETSKADGEKQKTYSSSQTYEFPSPVMVQGVPQNVNLNQQEVDSYSSSSGSAGNSYYSNGYVEGGAVDSVAVPILVHGVPQSGQQYSSSSASGYYSSSSGASVPANSGYYKSQNSKLQGGTASTYDNVAVNPNAEHLCGGCFSSGSLSSSGVPVKNSYGISTSFSSNSRTVNGKKTENREASVAVNDNGKVDSYHTKS